MNKLQEQMYNQGERLVPYVSHDEAELVRHRSSYAFFHRVISMDIKDKSDVITVVDLGFGTGYGCALLCSLSKSHITGVDIGKECEIFARQYYPRSNVSYITQDLADFIPVMSSYDYVVSRGVLEHVPNGLALIEQIKYKRRIMIDVPYDEDPGNEHHVLTGIREEAFKHLGDIEIFYEDLAGAIYDSSCKPAKPNMIMVVISESGLPKVSSILDFPVPAVLSAELEDKSRDNIGGCQYEFGSRAELLSVVERIVKETEIVADLGCGIMPINYFRPKLHLMVEPCKEYSDILSYRYRGDKSVIVMRCGALEALKILADNSVDTIFLIDVIEHVDKKDGLEVINEAERVAREQIVVFTPLGFMHQHIEEGYYDAWGLSGAEFQEHRSGWMPEDFNVGWSFYICKSFHTQDHAGNFLEKPFGAFYAIRNFENKQILQPARLSEFRAVLPSEKALNQLQKDFLNLQEKFNNLQALCDYLQKSNDAISAEYQAQYRASEQFLQTISCLERELSVFQSKG